MENVSSSFDQKKQDMDHVEDASVKEEGHVSATTINSMTKNVAPASSATANSSPSSPPEDRNLSFIRNSPRNMSDDDAGVAGRPVHRTLPGRCLVKEIFFGSLLRSPVSYLSYIDIGIFTFDFRSSGFKILLCLAY